tara:strand:+ start:78 stop:605 length:528 start_codon:yes stop_codon:yes gene_type:complete
LEVDLYYFLGMILKEMKLMRCLKAYFVKGLYIMSYEKSSSVITAEGAMAAIQAAAAKGTEIDRAVNIVVADNGGNVVASLRMNGAMLMSYDIARDKAFTSAATGAPTGVLYDVLVDAGPGVLAGIVKREGIAAFGGGLPILSNGILLGAIGVSGASEEEDIICAQAGIDALGMSE